MKNNNSIMERLVGAGIPVEKAAELTARCITKGKGVTQVTEDVRTTDNNNCI